MKDLDSPTTLSIAISSQQQITASTVKKDSSELEEREKVVRKMWDVYTHSASVRLPRFWLEAFEAAYEYLSSDVPGVRDTAV
ncbi:hypothetical protein CRYUN_Cryun35bG0022900 [Craigia yunnanensis]